MKIVDLNVLLYAVNRDAVHHAPVRLWWENALSASEPIGVAWAVLLGFLRIATNPRIFANPLGLQEVLGRVDIWIAHPNVRVVTETNQHWNILRQLLRETGTYGNLTTDAHLASLAIAQGATLVSCDADFSRFPNLRWENPIAS